MKTARKVLLLVLCAALLVSATVMGTLAYLTDSETVTNTFSVGNVVITLDEQDVDDSDNDENTTERDQANKYHLLPGHTYIKDPIVHVDPNSEDCYLFVTIDNQIAAIEATGDTTVAAQMKAKGWAAVDNVANTYVYVGTAEGASAPLAVSANSDITVFEKIVIAGSVDNNTLASYASKTITVTAYAVQKDGFENSTAAQIWNATFGAPANA